MLFVTAPAGISQAGMMQQQQQTQSLQNSQATIDALWSALLMQDMMLQQQQQQQSNIFDLGYQPDPHTQTSTNDFAAFAIMGGGGMGFMDGMI